MEGRQRILLLFTQYWSSAINSHSKIVSRRETNFICTNYNLYRALDIRTKINTIRIQVSFLTLLEEGQNIHGSPQTNIPRCLPSPALSDTRVDSELDLQFLPSQNLPIVTKVVRPLSSVCYLTSQIFRATGIKTHPPHFVDGIAEPETIKRCFLSHRKSGGSEQIPTSPVTHLVFSVFSM